MPKSPSYPARIVLSHNMLIQNQKAPKKTFKNFDEAYTWGLQKWGSGTYEGSAEIMGTPDMGWIVKEIKKK